MQGYPIQKCNVLILGAGPAGLCMAMSAVMAGLSVCVVEKRKLSQYTRDQKIFLNPTSREYFVLLYDIFDRKEKIDDEDKQFLKKLKGDYGIFIHEIEKFLFRRLLEVKEKTPEQVSLIGEYELSHVSLEKGVATISSTQSEKLEEQMVAFDYLVDASGISHAGVTLVNQTLPPEKQIVYQTDFKQPHKYHVSLYVPSIETDKEPIEYRHLNQSEHTEEISFRIKDGLYQAIVFAKHGNNIECNVNCEIQKKLYDSYYAAKAAFFDTSSENDLDEYLIQVNNLKIYIENKIKKELNRDDIKITFKKGAYDAPHINVFITVLAQASKSFVYYPIANGFTKPFIIIGDALRVGYYPLGHGLNHAILQAKKCWQVFICDPPQLTEKLLEYNHLCKELGSDAKVIIGLGSIFRHFVWDKGEQFAKDTFEEHQRRSIKHPIHELAEKSKLEKLDKLYAEDSLQFYVTNRDKKNILHFAKSFKVFLWLLDKDKKMFDFLLRQQDKYDSPPLLTLLNCDDFSLEKFSYIFHDPQTIAEFRDTKGNTVAHIIMLSTNFRYLENLIEWVFKTNPRLFIEKNSAGFDSIDFLCRGYKSVVNSDLALKQIFGDALRKLKNLMENSTKITISEKTETIGRIDAALALVSRLEKASEKKSTLTH